MTKRPRTKPTAPDSAYKKMRAANGLEAKVKDREEHKGKPPRSTGYLLRRFMKGQLKEEAPINNVGSGNIAGTDNNPPVNHTKAKTKRKLRDIVGCAKLG